MYFYYTHSFVTAAVIYIDFQISASSLKGNQNSQAHSQIILRPPELHYYVEAHQVWNLNTHRA